MDKIMIGLTVLLFVFIGADLYSKVNHWNKCKDAGGVYVTTTVCINPSAVIEVN